MRPVRGAACAPCCAGGISLLRGWRVCALRRGSLYCVCVRLAQGVRDAAAQALNACLCVACLIGIRPYALCVAFLPGGVALLPGKQ